MGIIITPDNIALGNFKGDMMHGKMRSFASDGNWYDENYEYHELNGWRTTHYEDGRTEKHKYVDGDILWTHTSSTN